MYSQIPTEAAQEEEEDSLVAMCLTNQNKAKLDELRYPGAQFPRSVLGEERFRPTGSAQGLSSGDPWWHGGQRERTLL